MAIPTTPPYCEGGAPVGESVPVGRRGRRSAQPGPGGGLDALLAPALGGLELRDLVLDGGEELLALCKRALDLGLMGRARRDDLLLLLARLRELGLPGLDLRPELAHLAAGSARPGR